MNFAPIIIPTLNRCDHLKACLESLNNNHNAENTEVFVSVDYPPSEKYIEGHKQICNYLKNAQFKFKAFTVYYQKHNLGIKGENSNYRFLLNIVKKNYDRWIVSEDDNIFSPNFIDFLNKGLNKFENDKSVLSICGYSFFYNLKFKDNNFFFQHADYNAWGHAVWKSKFEKVLNCDVNYLRKIVFNPIKLIKIWRVSSQRVGNLLFLSYKKNYKIADNFYTLYMINEDMYQVMPKISKVRNMGWDSSGIHCIGFDETIVKKHLTQKIDECDSFEYVGKGTEYLGKNQNIIKREDFIQVDFLKLIVKLVIRYILFWK